MGIESITIGSVFIVGGLFICMILLLLLLYLIMRIDIDEREYLRSKLKKEDYIKWLEEYSK